MTENYSQSVEIKMSKKTRSIQIAILVFFALAVALLGIAAAVSWYIVISAAVLFALGCVFVHIFNNTPKMFIYDFSTECLVVVKMDAVYRQRRILLVNFEDVQNFEIMQTIPEQKDVCACENTGDIGVYQLVYKENDTIRTLFFQPDEYMVALINSALENRK